MEAVDLHTMAVGHHGRETAHFMFACDTHVLVGIDDTEVELAVVLEHHLVQ